jgi:L-ascorbate metabolism protein UlaG (beta-lactamase superfamily)
MRIVKLGHACVRLEKDDKALVIDPGAFSEFEAVDSADGILLTHEHIDHFDPERLRRVEAPIFTGAGTAKVVVSDAPDLSERISTVGDGDTFEISGFAVSVHGEHHALIHADIPRVANTAFLVDDEVFHPGDSFTPPPRPVPTLLMPLNAPWMRLADAIDFARQHSAGRAVAIHDGLLNETGLKVGGGVCERLLSAHHIDYVRVEPGTEL